MNALPPNSFEFTEAEVAWLFTFVILIYVIIFLL